MADMIIKTSLPRVKTEVILENQELKISIGAATIFVHYEKDIEIQTNYNLNGHFIEFVMDTYNPVSSVYNEQKDEKIIHTSKVKLRLVNAKKLNPNFIDIISTDEDNMFCYIV